MDTEETKSIGRMLMGFPLRTPSIIERNGRSSSSKMKEADEPYRPPNTVVDIETKPEDPEDPFSLRDIHSQKNIWNYSRKSILTYILKVLAGIEISYSGFTVIMILALKIYKGSDDRTRLAKTALVFDEIQYHLRGLGLRFINVIDIDSIEDFVAGAIWFMFALGILLHILHLVMAIYFFRGLQTGHPAKLKRWMIFGFVIPILDILFLPLIFAICDNAGHIAGIWPLCQPTGSKWVHILVKILFYSSALLTYVLRRELQMDAIKLENYKLNLIEARP